jgi:hypothetical protein
MSIFLVAPKISNPYYCMPLLLATFLLLVGAQAQSALAEDIESLTPTYDPLQEPIVPDHPTDYELGRNWYWHYCMPCHGDKGQGLTDEWRAVWEQDHQDCWGKGCHAGERSEDSFKIPTVVPPVVSNVKLARFSSLETLYGYLKSTHPPQSPGSLEEEQYRAIAVYIFSENGRLLVDFTLTPTITPTFTRPTLPDTAPLEQPSQPPNLIALAGLGMILILVAIWGMRKRR